MRLTPRSRRFRRKGWIAFAAVLVAIILVIGVGITITTLRAQMHPLYQSAVGTPVFVPSQTATARPLPSGSVNVPAPPSPISGPPSKGAPPRLPRDVGLVYTSGKSIYLLTADMAEPEQVRTPGYLPLIPPILTNDGHLLYAGTGLYLADLLHQDTHSPLQIASIDAATQVIASAVISPDGAQVFWSVEPRDGSGTLTISTATLSPQGASPAQVLSTEPADTCPCYMLFGLGTADNAGQPTLLLSDNLGSPGSPGNGLWTFDLTGQQVGTELLAADQGQRPLTLSPDRALVAYALTTGEVPEPTDESVPEQISSQLFGNSLTIASLHSGGVASPVTIVPPQAAVQAFSTYHWITTPLFSPDNQQLAYIQFSADDTGPYDRHSSLYLARADGKSAPALVATFSARLVELGSWLDNQTVLLYADSGLYALNTHTAALSLLGTVSDYSAIVGLVGGINGNGSKGGKGSPTVATGPLGSHLNAPPSLGSAPAQPLPHQPAAPLQPVCLATANIRGCHRGQ